MISIKRFFLLLVFCTFLFAEEPTVEERIKAANQTLITLRKSLEEKYALAAEMSKKEAGKEEYETLLKDIKKLREEIFTLQKESRAKVIERQSAEEEEYGFWDLGETTLSQLILEYGSGEYVYLIPPELGLIKLQMFSTLYIPKSSWNEMIELILLHNGIGIKQLNPYVRQLYLMKHDLAHVEAIAHSKEELDLLPSHALVFYLFTTPPEQTKLVLAFFDRFSDSKQVTMQIVGSKLVMVSTKENIEKLLRFYEALWEKEMGKVVRVIPLMKMSSVEAEKVLKAFFQDSAKVKSPFFPSTDDLAIFVQSASLTLVGPLAVVDRAEKVLHDLESQLDDPGSMTVFWYTCKHSTPEDLAQVLEKVYSSLAQSITKSNLETKEGEETKAATPSPTEGAGCSPRCFPYNPVMPVNPNFVQPGADEKDISPKSFGNFIVDPKTGSLLVCIKKEELPKIKALIKKLDVPKKMVQIEVLLVEKKLLDRKQTGMNLLKIGSPASQKDMAGISFDTTFGFKNRGILEFILSRPKTHAFPAFDVVMNFLMAQEDVHINSNPSVIAINQTPAKIVIVDEVSINNGAVQINNGGGGTTVEKTYSRAQYGVTIIMTPTIHAPNEDDKEDKEQGFVTLQTDVTFDTPAGVSLDDRPPITRRHIKNEVRIADGETVILGGLRKKTEEDTKEKIPFLGDIPGIGKLFGTTKMHDSSTEMLIFITPKIMKDPVEDLRKAREEQLKKRPGDIPEFLEKMEEARCLEKKKFFENSMKLLFDKI